jgi:hypothetical protein
VKPASVISRTWFSVVCSEVLTRTSAKVRTIGFCPKVRKHIFGHTKRLGRAAPVSKGCAPARTHGPAPREVIHRSVDNPVDELCVSSPMLLFVAVGT